MLELEIKLRQRNKINKLFSYLEDKKCNLDIADFVFTDCC